MNAILQTIDAAQAVLTAHPAAVHHITTALHWAGQSFGFLRTLDWVWTKFRKPAVKPTVTNTTVTVTKTITTTITIEKRDEHKAA